MKLQSNNVLDATGNIHAYYFFFMKRSQRLCLSVLAALLLSFWLVESSFIGTFLGHGHEIQEASTSDSNSRHS